MEGTKAEETSQASKESESDSGFIKKDEYLELNSSVEQLNAKIRSKKENLKKLLLEKENVKGAQDFKAMVKEIETEYREINELTEALEKKKAVLRFRFPEKSFGKTKGTVKTQDIEEIGAEAASEKELESLLNFVEFQYQNTIRPHHTKSKQSIKGTASDRQPTHFTEEVSEETSESQVGPDDFSKPILIKR